MVFHFVCCVKDRFKFAQGNIFKHKVILPAIIIFVSVEACVQFMVFVPNLLSRAGCGLIDTETVLHYIRGLPLSTYAPRGGGGSSLLYICIAHYMQKGWVQIACKIAYVLNGRPLC